MRPWTPPTTAGECLDVIAALAINPEPDDKAAMHYATRALELGATPAEVRRMWNTYALAHPAEDRDDPPISAIARRFGRLRWSK